MSERWIADRMRLIDASGDFAAIREAIGKELELS